MTLFRRAHSFDDMMQDPDFRFNVIRHIGGSEMVSHWLLQQDDPMAKMYGERLQIMLKPFFKDEDVGGWQT